MTQNKQLSQTMKEKREQFNDVIYSVSHSEKYETVLKEVIESGKENELEEVLDEYVKKRENEIQTICNDQFQKFIGCTEQLGTVKEKMLKTQERLKKTSTQAKESSDLLYSKVKLLSNNRVSTVNIMKTLTYVDKLKTIFETVKAIEDDIRDGNISMAFIVYDRLRKLPLFEENEYKIVQLINMRLETIKVSLKQKAAKLFERWCEAISNGMDKIGKDILEHNNHSYEKQSENETDFDPFEKNGINFVWLYEAYFIHTSFHTENEFIQEYLELQKERFERIQNTPNPTLQQMLNDLLGFFVIEHHVQQTTEYIINSDNLQQMWNMSAEKLKAFSQSFLTLKQGLDLFLKSKDEITVFIKSVKIYDYDASPLISVLQGIFSNYATKIGEQKRKEVEEQMSIEMFNPMTPTDEELVKFMNLIEKEANPNVVTVKVPTIYSKTFYSMIQSIEPFIVDMEKYEMELDMSLEPICETLQSYICDLITLYPAFLNLNESATLKESYQMLVDLEELEKTTPLLCMLISDHFGKRFNDLNKIKANFNLKQKIDTIYRSTKEWICDKYVQTIKTFIGPNDTTPSSSVDRPHDWMGQIINFTNQQFVLFSILTPQTVSEIQTEMLQLLNQTMTELITKSVKINCHFMKMYQHDITQIESFCTSNPSFKSQVYTFVWCKQIANFFNAKKPDEILNEEIRNKNYNKLTDRVLLVQLIGKFDMGSLPRGDGRKKGLNTVKSQLPKLKN